MVTRNPQQKHVVMTPLFIYYMTSFFPGFYLFGLTVVLFHTEGVLMFMYYDGGVNPTPFYRLIHSYSRCDINRTRTVVPSDHTGGGLCLYIETRNTDDNSTDSPGLPSLVLSTVPVPYGH